MAASASAPPLTAPAATFARPHERDPLERLMELAELRDAGVITPAEFETQKTNILGDI
jgi:hypothetical protein